MRYLLYILLFIASACTAQVHDYNLRIDSPKTTDSTYCLLTATTGSNFAGRGQFKSLPQLATLLQPFLSGGTTPGIDDVLAEGQALTALRIINIASNQFKINTNTETAVFIDEVTDDYRLGKTVAGAYINFTSDHTAYVTAPSSSGTFGINNSTPTEALDVVGNGKFTGTISATDGTGQIDMYFSDPSARIYTNSDLYVTAENGEAHYRSLNNSAYLEGAGAQIIASSGAVAITAATDLQGNSSGTVQFNANGGNTSFYSTDDIVFTATDQIQFTGKVILPTSTPSSATDTGVTGQIAWDASYIYICTATNTWKRVAIATW